MPHAARRPSNFVRRGHSKERKLLDWYRARGWWAQRAPASQGIDVVAAKAGEELHFVELKMTERAYHNFGPAERAHLILEARKAGAVPLLCHWPPRQKEPHFIPASEWPGGDA